MIRRTVSKHLRLERSRFGSVNKRARGDEFVSISEIEQTLESGEQLLSDISVDDAVDLFDRGEISDCDLIERLSDEWTKITHRP